MVPRIPRLAGRLTMPNIQTLLEPGLSMFAQRDSIPDPPRTIYLPARPFNHLGVWAYLAIGFIILATSTVAAYFTYSCYHSARKRAEGDVFGKFQVPGEASGSRFAEKMRKRERTAVELKPLSLGFGFGHARAVSDSKRKMIQASAAGASQASIVGLESTASFSSPPLAHTSDRAASYLPFHLPPPPPSPTKAHKHVVGQYRGGLMRSVSPTPSVALPGSPPVIRPKDTLHKIRSDRKPQKADGAQGLGEKHPTPKFDSNNIRFVPPLNPFMTQSTVKLWNEPKLSPIHGSIISPPSPSGKSGLVSSKTAANTTADASLQPLAAARSDKLSSRSPRGEAKAKQSPIEGGRRSDRAKTGGVDKENTNPVPKDGYPKRTRALTPTVSPPIKPSPGSF